MLANNIEDIMLKISGEQEIMSTLDLWQDKYISEGYT
jgi:hypothetical protein